MFEVFWGEYASFAERYVDGRLVTSAMSTGGKAFVFFRMGRKMDTARTRINVLIMWNFQFHLKHKTGQNIGKRKNADSEASSAASDASEVRSVKQKNV